MTQKSCSTCTALQKDEETGVHYCNAEPPEWTTIYETKDDKVSVKSVVVFPTIFHPEKIVCRDKYVRKTKRG